MSQSSPSRREFLSVAAAVSLAAACSSDAPVAEQRPRPNILLVVPDQQRPDWLGVLGGIPVRTPHVDALAARGVRFTNAVCASPLCAPSRACLASGKEYDRCGVPGNNVDFSVEQTSYYRLLRESGYHVMGCGKFDLHKATEDWRPNGTRLLSEWGFSEGIDSAGKWDAIRSGSKTPMDPYMAYLHETGLVQTHVEDFNQRRGRAAFSNTDPTPLSEHAYCDNWIGGQAVRLLQGAPADKPWHLQVNFAGPHDPLDATKRMLEPYRGVAGFPQPNRNDQLPPETHTLVRQNYAAMIENIDRWLGIFLEEVEKRGELDNTLVVFTSDHGEMLGDHNRWQKRVPYQASAGVPLVAAGPGVKGGRVSAAPTSIIDLAATFLQAADVAVPADMDSRSLLPLLEGKTESHREVVLSGLEPWRLAYDGRYKLIRGFEPSVEVYYPRGVLYAQTKQHALLFDLEADPHENENLADKAPEIVKRLDEALRG